MDRHDNRYQPKIFLDAVMQLDFVIEIPLEWKIWFYIKGLVTDGSFFWGCF